MHTRLHCLAAALLAVLICLVAAPGFFAAAPAAEAGRPLDPRTTILPTYLLPDDAAVDGSLDEWRAIPPMPAEAFHRNQARDTIIGSADFGPSLRCGMKQSDPGALYFLVLVRDAQLRAEDSYNGLAGDCLELYFDFGREERDRTTPDWFKVPYSNSYYPRQEPPRSLGQFVIRPPTLQGATKVYKSSHAEAWQLAVSSVPVVGGVAYEVRLDTASVLKDLNLPALPALIGVDIGFIDQDWAPRLEADNWCNAEGIYRLFGDWVDDAVPTHYGRISTHPIPPPAGEPSTLPQPLHDLFGDRVSAEQLQKALREPVPAWAPDLVTWAGLRGLALTPALVRELMASAAPTVREACLAVLALTAQPDAAAIQTGVDAAYAAPQTPHALALANLLSQRLALGPADRLQPLLAHEDPTVAFTAAAALARVGDASDVARLDAACEARCAALAARTGGKPVSDGGYHHWYPGTVLRATTIRYFFGMAREALLSRLEPATSSRFTPVREVKAANTDLERFIPIDGNNVYNAKGLLRRWPASGPRRLWRVTVGQGKSAVVEAGGRAFTAALADGRPWAVCLDPLTGKTLWRQPLAGTDTGAREIVASPVVDGERVYFVPGGRAQEDGLTVVCLRAADGGELWRGRDELEHVAACPTPLIVGDVLYCPLTGGNATQPVLMAVNKQTGQVIWRAPASDPGGRRGSGVASPSYQVIDGIGQIILSVYNTPQNEVWGVNAKTGERFWRYGTGAHYAMIPSPVAAGSRVFLSDGLPPFSACLQMVRRDAGIQARQVYRDARNQCNLYNTVAVLDGWAYGFSNAALQCTRLDDGKLLWQQGDADWVNGPQLIAADGLLFALGKFELILAEASAAGYRELGRVRHGTALGYPQQPTLANGRLYVRGDTEVVCYDVLGH